MEGEEGSGGQRGVWALGGAMAATGTKEFCGGTLQWQHVCASVCVFFSSFFLLVISNTHPLSDIII